MMQCEETKTYGRLVLEQKPVILLIEEDSAARGLMKLLLTSQGYDVMVSAPLPEAERLWFENQHGVALVVVGLITDPAIRGKLLHKIIQARPDIKVVIANGYDRSRVTNVIDLEGCWYIRKPFERETLLGMVGKIVQFSCTSKS